MTWRGVPVLLRQCQALDTKFTYLEFGGVKEGQLSMRFGEKGTYGLQKQEKHMRLGCIPITLFRDAQRLS